MPVEVLQLLKRAHLVVIRFARRHVFDRFEAGLGKAVDYAVVKGFDRQLARDACRATVDGDRLQAQRIGKEGRDAIAVGRLLARGRCVG